MDSKLGEGRGLPATEGGGLPAVAGGSFNPEQFRLLRAAEGSMNALLDDAVEPGLEFASGAVSGITAGLSHQSGGRTARTAGVFGPARRGDQASVGTPARVRLPEARGSFPHERSAVRGRKSRRRHGQGARHRRTPPGRPVPRPALWLIRCNESARAEVEWAIGQREALQSDVVDGIAGESSKLARAYHGEMVWTDRVARWLSWAAPLISTLAVQVGGGRCRWSASTRWAPGS